MNREDVRAWVPFLGGTFTRLAALPVPTIAVIGDRRQRRLGTRSRATSGSPSRRPSVREVALAIIPGAGGTQRLTRLIGPARAKRWIFTARMHSADEALAEGAVDLVTGAGQGIEAARGLAREIAGNGPLGVRAAKRAIDGGFGLPMDEALAVELRAYESIIPTEDRREAIKALRRKRTPALGSLTSRARAGPQQHHEGDDGPQLPESDETGASRSSRRRGRAGSATAAALRQEETERTRRRAAEGDQVEHEQQGVEDQEDREDWPS
jgi:hypothetical protein